MGAVASGAATGLVAAVAIVVEPIDYAMTAVQCVTAGCSAADVALTLVPGAIGPVVRQIDNVLDVAKAAENAGDAVKAVENGSDAVQAAENGGDLAKVADISTSYARPSGYRKGVRDKVWESAKRPDGTVRDPLTGQVMNKDAPWDMGHKPGYEFRKHQQSAAERGISRKRFLDEYYDPAHHRPELPRSNRGHRGEDLTDSYFGP